MVEFCYYRGTLEYKNNFSEIVYLFCDTLND
ncbi:protein of unknown function [Tenacibaculum aestuariivivum]